MAKKTAAKKAKPKAKAAKPAKDKKAKKPAAKKPESERIHWLDDKAEQPLIDNHARKLQTFIDAMADGIIESGELKAQEKRLVKLMKEVEPILTDDVHARVTDLLCELTAYNIMQLLHELTEARRRWSSVVRGLLKPTDGGSVIIFHGLSATDFSGCKP